MSRQRWLWGAACLALCLVGCEIQSSDTGTSAVPAASAGAVSQSTQGGEIRCYFSPRGGCTDAVVQEINHARQSISVQAYSFTSASIANALKLAHQRGVKVIVVLDKSQRTEQYSSADFVAHAGIETHIDAAHAIAHNKIMLIDGTTLISGSFNFTKAAENNNAENLLIIHAMPDLYAAYEQNFQHHLEHSQPYAGRGQESPTTPAPPRVTRSAPRKPRAANPNQMAPVDDSDHELPDLQNAGVDQPARIR